MILAEHFKGPRWEVIGTDISTRVLERTTRLYPMLQAEKIRLSLLKNTA